MKALKAWFMSEIFMWKCVESIIWILALQFVSVHTFLIFFSIFSWHPFNNFKGWLFSMFTISVIAYQILLSISTLGISLLHIHHFSVKPAVHTTRLRLIWHFLRPQFLLHLLTHCIAGGIVSRCLVGLIGGDVADLELPCESCNNSTLNEKHLFITLHGMFSGCMFSITYFRKELYCLHFSIIQQLKFLSVKSQAFDMINKSLHCNVRHIKWYYFLFYVLGVYPRQWISTLLSLQIREESSLLCLRNLLDVRLLFLTFVTGVLLYLIWNCSLCIFEIFLTERIAIPVEPTFEAEKEKTLSYALKCESIPLLQYLGYLDLKLLSQHSLSRRLQIFTISQPGGHPYNWEGISKECLLLLEMFTDSMNYIAFPPSESSIKTNSASICGTSIFRNTWTDSTAQKFLEVVKKNPLFKYFLNDITDAKMKKNFSGCQPVIWAVEALSFLVSASYKEDQYGVVQKSLPKIICSLLEMHVALERQQKLATLTKRPMIITDPPSNDIQLRQALYSAVNSGLYHIVCTFDAHIRGISLPEEQWRYLKQYIEFKE